MCGQHVLVERIAKERAAHPRPPDTMAVSKTTKEKEETASKHCAEFPLRRRRDEVDNAAAQVLPPLAQRFPQPRRRSRDLPLRMQIMDLPLPSHVEKDGKQGDR